MSQSEETDAARRAAAIMRECADAITALAASAWREQREMTSTEWASVITFAVKAKSTADSVSVMAAEAAHRCAEK